MFTPDELFVDIDSLNCIGEDLKIWLVLFIISLCPIVQLTLNSFNFVQQMPKHWTMIVIVRMKVESYEIWRFSAIRLYLSHVLNWFEASVSNSFSEWMLEIQLISIKETLF